MGTNESSIIKVKNSICEYISPVENMQHYALREGFVFIKGFRDRIFDEIVVRSPSDSNCYTPILPKADKTIDDYIDLINGAELDHALVFAKDLSFLPKCQSLKFLSICPSDDLDGEMNFEPLYYAKNIKSLCVKMTYGEYPNVKMVRNEIDYSRIKGLVCLHVSFDSSNHKNYNKVDTLKTLSISQYPKKDLKDLFSSQILDSLFIIISRIVSLDGISQSHFIQNVHLCYNRSLKDINPLADVKSTLRVLKIENCPKISDFSVLQELKNLEVLILRGKNKIPSLRFISELKKLKILIFDMEIEDGDLTHCLFIPYVSCEKRRKYYNLKSADLPHNSVDLKNTGVENVEFWRRI